MIVYLCKVKFEEIIHAFDLNIIHSGSVFYHSVDRLNASFLGWLIRHDIVNQNLLIKLILFVTL